MHPICPIFIASQFSYLLFIFWNAANKSSQSFLLGLDSDISVKSIS